MALFVAVVAPGFARNASAGNLAPRPLQLAQATPEVEPSEAEAAAEGDEEPMPQPTAPIVRDPVFHHTHQFGLSIMPGIGYRIIVPYGDPDKDGISCNDGSSTASTGKRVCTSRVPFFVEVQASFGITQRLDIITDLRFGVEADKPGGKPGPGDTFALAPGLRFWLDDDVNFKFFTTVQAVYDNTDQNQPKVSNTDFGFRNANGMMYDPIRNIGFYFQFAETMGFKRWFRMELDVGFGVQVRVP